MGMRDDYGVVHRVAYAGRGAMKGNLECGPMYVSTDDNPPSMVDTICVKYTRGPATCLACLGARTKYLSA